METDINVKVDVLRQFMRDGFVAAGVSESDAEISSNVLIASDLRGIDSHGIGRFKMYIDRIQSGQIDPAARPEVIKETETTAVVDAHNGMGQVVGVFCMQKAIDKARRYGMGAVSTRNSTHFGIDGYYPLMALKQGCMGLAFTNARPSIAPTFGVEPMLGTNPIAMGAPVDQGSPFVIDAATSITQRGKIELYERKNADTPEGTVIDRQGEYMTDTPEILKALTCQTAALLPVGGATEEMGGHKGDGWAAMVEILCASLCNGQHGKPLSGIADGKKVPHRLGHFFMAIDIEHFVPLEESKKTTGEICRNLIHSQKAPGQDRIFYAGEKEYECEKERLKNGVPINPNLQRIIKQLIVDLKLGVYDFGF